MNVKLIPASEVEVGMYIDTGRGWWPVLYTHGGDIMLRWIGCDYPKASINFLLRVDSAAHVLVGIQDEE